MQKKGAVFDRNTIMFGLQSQSVRSFIHQEFISCSYHSPIAGERDVRMGGICSTQSLHCFVAVVSLCSNWDMQPVQLMLQEKKRCWIISCRYFIDSARSDTCHIFLYFIDHTQLCGTMYVQVSWQIQGDILECFTLFPLLQELSVQEKTWVWHMKLLVCN